MSASNKQPDVIGQLRNSINELQHLLASADSARTHGRPSTYTKKMQSARELAMQIDAALKDEAVTTTPHYNYLIRMAVTGGDAHTDAELEGVLETYCGSHGLEIVWWDSVNVAEQELAVWMARISDDPGHEIFCDDDSQDPENSTNEMLYERKPEGCIVCGGRLVIDDTTNRVYCETNPDHA